MEGGIPMDLFAARLRADREEAGLTVRQLADLSGISFSYITKIEKERAGKGISPELISKLAEVLQNDVLDYLFLSGVVPSPLDDLLSDGKSRSFIRALLSTRLKSTGWERLQHALVNSNDNKSTPRRKTLGNRTKNSRRKSVA